MLVGQDESTYHQYVFSSKHWKGPTGLNFILPKSSGEILMISGFQSREFSLGLGSRLTPDILSKINESRKGCKYLSSEDAKLISRDEYKHDINDDPALRFFEAGINKDGYWNSSHIKIQLEDIVDCLVVIYPEFDFKFLFDQSSGHCKVRGDGLVISNMNVNYGGKASIM